VDGAAGESLPQGSRVSELQSDAPSTSFSAATSLSQHGGVRQPDPGGAAWASSSVEAGATAGPASLAAMATAEPASAPPQSAAGDSRPDLPLPAAAAKPALLPKSQPYVVSPVAAAAAAAPAAAGLSDNSSVPTQVDNQYRHLPQVPQQPSSTHSATAASLSPGLADRIRGSDLQQQLPSPNLASPPPALEHDAAARLAERASFEASHSPFIALSRTASGRMSTGSAAHDSDLGGDVTSRSSHTSRLTSVTQPGEDTLQLSAAAPGELMVRPAGSRPSTVLLVQSMPVLVGARLGSSAEQGLSSHGATPASFVVSTREHVLLHAVRRAEATLVCQAFCASARWS
jgi:hypothetical protein